MKNHTILIGGIALMIGIVTGHFLTNRLSEDRNVPNITTPNKDKSRTKVYAEGITIPLINFEEVLIVEAIDYLRAISRTEREVEGGPQVYHLNFIVSDPDHSAKPISLILRDVRLDQLCERIAQVSGMAVSFDDEAIVFQSKNQGEQVAPRNR